MVFFYAPQLAQITINLQQGR